MPNLDCFAAPVSHSFAFKGLWQANWLQCFEVGMDPGHPSFFASLFARCRFGRDGQQRGRQTVSQRSSRQCGWHLHQSLVDARTGRNVFQADSSNTLSPIGIHWLAGLIEHASGICALANPYLYVASQIYSVLNDLNRGVVPPHANSGDALPLPANLNQALITLQVDAALGDGFGVQVLAWCAHIKRQEIARYKATSDKTDWLLREYFSRF